MKRKYVCLWSVAMASLLSFGGCNGTATENTELRGRVKELESTLRRTENERDLLKQDVGRFEASLKQTESRLADAVTTRNGLQAQVKDLGAARQELTTRVELLNTARVELQEKVAELSEARDLLQTRVEDLTQSRNDLQNMVENLVDTRGVLEKQVATLTKARDAAREDAIAAQARMAQLNTKLKAQTEQMADLQTQVVSIRAVLEQLQQKLE